MTTYVKFTEFNDYEAETWYFWLPLEGNEDALDQLDRDIIEDYETYLLEQEFPISENEVNLLVKHGGDGGYLPLHTKVDGVLSFPDGFEVDDLYKGGVRNLFIVPPPVEEPDPEAPRPATSALASVVHERDRQDAKWGQQNHPDRLGQVALLVATDILNTPVPDESWFHEKLTNVRLINDALNERGEPSWDYILLEEVLEALTAVDETELRAELAQVAAVALAQIEAIDRRNGIV